MAKITTSFRLEPRVQFEIKKQARDNNLSVGDFLEAVIDYCNLSTGVVDENSAHKLALLWSNVVRTIVSREYDMPDDERSKALTEETKQREKEVLDSLKAEIDKRSK